MQFNRRIKQLLEAVADVPPPPAIIQRSINTVLTFDNVLDFIKQHEGVKPHVYLDSKGIPTVGIGFNLLRPDAKSMISNLGLDYNKVLSGTQDLSNQQMHDLFNASLKIAYADAKKYIPSFDNLPRDIKLGVLDMSFNLGFNRLSKFIKTKEFIMKGDYKSAANELKNSKWATQVGKRANNIIKLFSSVS